MDLNRDMVGLIAEVVKEETIFLRHYLGMVSNNKDKFRKGRIQVTLPELGFMTPAEGFWCWPRQGDSLSVPEVDSIVEVYFMGGNPDRPVYMSYTSEMENMTPTTFDGEASTRVVFESPKTNEGIKYDDLSKQLDIMSTMIKMNEGDEPFVLGNKLITFLNNLLTELGSHTHPTAALGPPSPPSAPFSPLAGDETSTEIFGK